MELEEGDGFGAGVRPAKISKICLGDCLCHVKNITGRLTPFSDKSWSTLWRAADVRKDKTFVFLRDGNTCQDVPSGGYHCECYQAYINKKDLDRIGKQALDDVGNIGHVDGEFFLTLVSVLMM